MVIGYEYLRQHLRLPIPPRPTPALVQPVIRVAPGANGTLAVPAAVAPRSDDPLEHLLFALKHEGTDLLVLRHALLEMPGDRIVHALQQTPTGRFVRQAGYLWEHFHRERLGGADPRGAYVPLFDPARYLTGPPRRDARWRVDFNGLGSLDYCPTVRRTPTIERLLAKDLLTQARRFAEEMGPVQLDRALAWAYLGETESSFAIERETPAPDKTASFAALLRQAGDQDVLTEDHLVALQNAALTNPFERASEYRTEQNWLRGPARGAVGVTYVPPPPDSVPDLMAQLLKLANDPDAIDPLVLAAVVSFGFVFIHPFMDGNGRLSRFLVHHVLGRSGRLPRGLVLPVSIAMKRHEADYLAALQQFSKAVREWWQVTWIDEGRFDCRLLSDDTLYRYWDATPAVEFMLAMAEQALQQDLREECRFLESYDMAWKAVNERFDLRDNALATLLLSAFQNHGTVSKHRRKQFADVVPSQAFDFIEEVVRRRLKDAPVRGDSH